MLAQMGGRDKVQAMMQQMAKGGGAGPGGMDMASMMGAMGGMGGMPPMGGGMPPGGFPGGGMPGMPPGMDMQQMMKMGKYYTFLGRIISFLEA